MIENNNFRGVLVVDDEPLVLKYTCSVIAGLGYQHVFKAADAQSARALLLTESISLVISDVSLPDGDGRQLLCDALAENPEIAGVLITGFATSELKLPPELCGRVQLVEKPFTAGDMNRVLADLMEESSHVLTSRT